MRRVLPGWFHRILGPPLVALALTGTVAAVAAQPAPSPGEQPVSVPLDAAIREAVVDALAEDLVRNYAHAPIGAKMAKAIQGKLAAGGYNGVDSPVTFAGALTADVHAVAIDKHLRVWFSDRSGPHMPSSTSIARAMMSRMRKMNAAIPQVEILEGNIGYMEVDGMPPPQFAKP